MNEAIAQFLEAIRINPNSAEEHYNLGHVFQEQRKLDEAIAEFREAICMYPEYVEAHHNLGPAFHDQMKLDEAVAEYKRSFTITPEGKRALKQAEETSKRWIEALEKRVGEQRR